MYHLGYTYIESGMSPFRNICQYIQKKKTFEFLFLYFKNLLIC